jgi:hypothetical protein
MTPSTTYKSGFLNFVLFLDGTIYSPLDDITSPQECILLITDAHVASFLIYNAYGDDLTGEEEPITRSSTLLFYKKAISAFMTHKHHQWGEISH